jgi:hypothetical protein
MVRKLNPIAYVLIGAGVVFYIMRYDFINLLPINERSAFLVSVAMIGYGLAIILLNYLRGDRYETSDGGILRDELKVLRNELTRGRYSKSEFEENKKKIKSLEEALKNLKDDKYQVSEEEKSKILEEIRNGILSDASSSILIEIENKYSQNIQSESQLNRIQEQLENTRLRLRQEISALGRRGNVNLVIGVLTTVAAVGILTTTVLDPNVKLTNETLVSHFAPRLTLSLFIEIFSFFFLKLYKSGLGEIKYFQNELTNIEMKFVSLDSALRFKNDDSINSVINEFSKTERNFVLDKGQSTVDIERSRLEVNGQNSAYLLCLSLSNQSKNSLQFA